MGPAIPMLFLSAVSAVQGYQAGKKQEEAQAKQAEAFRRSEQAKQRIADIRAARQRTQTIRQARVQRAEIEQAAELTGTAVTSGVAGGVASLGSQLRGEIGASRRITGEAREASIFNIRASEEAQALSGRAARLQGMSTIFSAGAAGFGKFV